MQKHHRILLVVSIGVFMSTMDSSMVNVALPTLMKVFGGSLAMTEWVVLMYLLVVTVTLLFWGYFANTIGQGRLYSRGILLFTIGSLCCSLSPSLGFLIGARFIQAIGASMMMAMGPALINSSYPREHLGEGLGMVGIATSLGLMTGPAVSGLLLRWSHWRFIFLVTVPIGLLVYIFWRKILLPIGRPRRMSGRATSFDLIGGVLYLFAVTISIVLLTQTHAGKGCCGQSALVWSWSFSLAAAFFWILFIVYELRQGQPLLPLRLFLDRFFAMAMVSAMLSFVVLFLVLLLMPFYLSSVRGFPPDRVGWFMMAVPLCVFFVAPLAGRLHDKIGARIIASGGLSICLFSLLLLTRLTSDSPAAFIITALALLGVGQAMFLAPNSAAALAGVAHDKSGITSSLLATSRNMGMLLGTAVAGFIFAHTYSRLTGGLDIREYAPGQVASFIGALHQTFVVGSWIGLVAVLTSWLRGQPENRESPSP
ncbi:MAG TPA: DHA2 family efflux MFS transporter permease subunit [Desulfobulbaceae bacterium]|nr:DHA2 family efflux MFS transporter permease subunit [Desulfobulbaceae bacterium]